MGQSPRKSPGGTTARHAMGLALILVACAWLRGHVVGPTVREALGLRLWPVVSGEAEPLDCDEAAYAYIGHRVARGGVLYRDVSENKPPGGYGLFALAVGLGGDRELTVRLLPIPMVLGTIALIWWIGLRLSGPWAAHLAAAAYALMSTDPCMSGDAATLEHPMNLFSVASLALMVRAWPGRGRLPIALAGACVGMAALVRQVAVVPLLVYLLALGMRGVSGRGGAGRIADVSALAAGFGLVAGAAVAVLAAQGAVGDAYDDVVRHASALATQLPPPPHSPPFLVRWLTSNPVPRDGRLPWPFGGADFLNWWGAGSWPLWLVAAPALAWLGLAGRDGARRLVVAWTLSAAVEVALPGLFWGHYYLLIAPGVALASGVAGAEFGSRAKVALRRADVDRAGAWGIGVLVLAVALAWTGVLRVRDYLLVPPERLSVLYKGGQTWVQLRQVGREIGRRSRIWDDPRLYVWGWQSPVYIYSGLDGVSRHFFADPLLEARARSDPDDPLVRPRLDRIVRDLRADPPEILFVGIPPFPGLRAILEERYAPWRLVPGAASGEGIWVEKGSLGRFAAEDPPRDRPR